MQAGHREYPRSVAFAPDGKTFVTASRDRTVKLWETETGRLVRGPEANAYLAPESISFAPDGRRLFVSNAPHTGHINRSLDVWDVASGDIAAKIDGRNIIIDSGANTLTAYAFNRDDIKSADATLDLKGAQALARRGVAHLVAVGVNSCANPRYDLKYAVADAVTFGGEFKRQRERLGRYERVEVTTLIDKQATKAGILAALAELAAKAEPEDAVVVFFAGHDTARENRYYLLPHDLGYTGAPAALHRAARRVPEIQLDEMARAAGRELSFADDERGLSLARRQGQCPRLYYRRELEARPLVVAKTGN